MATARDERDHVDPEDILHAAARDGAVIRFSDSVQTVDLNRRGRPRINRFFACRDDIESA